jgi:hypothetical protein
LPQELTNKNLQKSLPRAGAASGRFVTKKSAQRLPLRHHLEIVAVRGNRPLRTIVSGFIARKNISIGPL